MNELQIIENNNQRVLLTAQLAEVYGTNTDTITKNYNRNKERYQENKHYYCLEGEELKGFRANGQIDLLPSNVAKLYLWTEKGALLHAKSLGTDEAWAVYEKLVDTYFEVQKPKQMSAIEILAAQSNALVEIDRQLKTVSEQSNRTAEKLDKAVEIFAAPVSCDNWKEETNRKLNQLCKENGLNYQAFKGTLYTELEAAISVDLNARQRNLKERMKKHGAKYAECAKVTKLDIVSGDEKLKRAFDGIVKKYQATYALEN